MEIKKNTFIANDLNSFKIINLMEIYKNNDFKFKEIKKNFKLELMKKLEKDTFIANDLTSFKAINLMEVYKINNLNFKKIKENFKLELMKKLEGRKKLEKCLELSFLEMVRDSKKNRNTIAIIIKEMKEGKYLQVTTSKTLEIMEKIKHSFTQIVELSLKIHLVSIEDNRILRN